MRIGQLRHFITIEEVAATQDLMTGALTNGWATFAAVWASKEDLTGREYFAAQQVQSEVTTRFVMRHVDATAAMRIVHDGVTYNIASVAHDNRSRFTTILAVRR